MAWIPAENDMTVQTRLDRIGATVAANNIIRTVGMTARFFPRTLQRLPDSFQSNTVDTE
jgi:hypothetical protein